MCERWNDFRNFISDMGFRPPGKSIDRINNDGNYEPKNCRWASQKEQRRNSRQNKVLTVFGITACLTELCERFNLPYWTVRGRIDTCGWNPEDAFSKPIAVYKKSQRN
jgi:hypothetical protein